MSMVNLRRIHVKHHPLVLSYLVPSWMKPVRPACFKQPISAGLGGSSGSAAMLHQRRATPESGAGEGIRQPPELLNPGGRPVPDPDGPGGSSGMKVAIGGGKA
jgi:hypothetical protein